MLRRLSLKTFMFQALPLLVALSLVGCGGGSSSSVVPPNQWTQVWSDEFAAADGTPVDATKWTAETGGNGWGNNELEYYTARPVNAVQQGGNLVISALKETYTGPDGVTRNYTSARLKTEGNFSQAYGRFEARIKIPAGQGMWPAFWMLGDNIGSVGWPACGELDIMENIGKEPTVVHGSMHGMGFTGASLGSPYSLPNNANFADDFHLYAIEWEPGVVRFYVDSALYETRTPADLPPGAVWPFDHPFFIILNVAVGGDWPGSPDGTTVFPQTMQVDYVRVYKKTGM